MAETEAISKYYYHMTELFGWTDLIFVNNSNDKISLWIFSSVPSNIHWPEFFRILRWRRASRSMLTGLGQRGAFGAELLPVFCRRERRMLLKQAPERAGIDITGTLTDLI